MFCLSRSCVVQRICISPQVTERLTIPVDCCKDAQDSTPQRTDVCFRCSEPRGSVIDTLPWCFSDGYLIVFILVGRASGAKGRKFEDEKEVQERKIYSHFRLPKTCSSIIFSCMKTRLVIYSSCMWFRISPLDQREIGRHLYCEVKFQTTSFHSVAVLRLRDRAYQSHCWECLKHLSCY